MSQSVSEFWFDVKEARRQIAKEVEGSKEQPHDITFDRNGLVTGGTCWIVSQRNRDRNTVKGDVVLCGVMLAGQRLVESTHELATDEQIVALRNSHEKRAREIRELEEKKNTSIVKHINQDGSEIVERHVGGYKPQHQKARPEAGTDTK